MHLVDLFIAIISLDLNLTCLCNGHFPSDENAQYDFASYCLCIFTEFDGMLRSSR